MQESEIVYPFKDEYGCTWFNSNSMIPNIAHKEPCFICGRPTYTIDVDYHGFFCNSYVCNLVISFDLEGQHGQFSF
jgi:hypothetical protein